MAMYTIDHYSRPILEGACLHGSVLKITNSKFKFNRITNSKFKFTGITNLLNMCIATDMTQE